MRRLALLLLVGLASVVRGDSTEAVVPAPDTFRFTLPFPRPETLDETEANWRALERWANQAPFYEQVSGLRGELPSSPFVMSDPDHEPWGGSGAPAAIFEKFDGRPTVVAAQVWCDASSVDPFFEVMFSLHFTNTTGYDEYFDVARGGTNRFVLGNREIDGIPAGVYAVVLVVTTFGGPTSIAVNEQTEGGFTLRESLPPRYPVAELTP